MAQDVPLPRLQRRRVEPSASQQLDALLADAGRLVGPLAAVQGQGELHPQPFVVGVAGDQRGEAGHHLRMPA